MPAIGVNGVVFDVMIGNARTETLLSRYLSGDIKVIVPQGMFHWLMIQFISESHIHLVAVFFQQIGYEKDAGRQFAGGDFPPGLGRIGTIY